MGELSGERIVPTGRRVAPVLPIMYACGKCGHCGVLDAYEGPPTCLGKAGTDEGHSGEFMTPLYISKAGD